MMFLEGLSGGGAMFSNDKKVGIGLCFIGLFFYVLGLCMFLDRGFLAIGNFAFLMGLFSLTGLTGTLSFFKRKTKGSVFFFGGFILILIGWPFFTTAGFFLQMYGLL